MAKRAPARTVTAAEDETLFPNPARPDMRIVRRQWAEHASKWEGKEKRGERLSAGDKATLRRALLSWDEFGRQEALQWGARKLIAFRHRWKRWRLKTEAKLMSDKYLNADDVRFRA